MIAICCRNTWRDTNLAVYTSIFTSVIKLNRKCDKTCGYTDDYFCDSIYSYFTVNSTNMCFIITVKYHIRLLRLAIPIHKLRYTTTNYSPIYALCVIYNVSYMPLLRHLSGSTNIRTSETVSSWSCAHYLTASVQPRNLVSLVENGFVVDFSLRDSSKIFS